MAQTTLLSYSPASPTHRRRSNSGHPRPGRLSFGLLVLILFLVVPSRAAAGGAGCATADPCTTGGKIGLTINCDPAGPPELTITPTSCSGGPGSATYSLLRVAVRCFDSGEPAQARYTDRHGFDVASGTWDLSNRLISGCANFLAAAHWNRNGTEVQAQCVKVVTPALVPDCVQATGDETADLTSGVSLYPHILPQTGTNSCTPDPVLANHDASRVELRSGAPERTYQGVVGGRYICTQSTSAFAACDDVDSTIRPRGQYGNVFGYTVGPNDYRVYKVNDPGVGFNNCCDRELSTEIPEYPNLNCTSNPIECSPLDILCASSVGMAVCRAGPTPAPCHRPLSCRCRGSYGTGPPPTSTRVTRRPPARRTSPTPASGSASPI